MDIGYARVSTGEQTLDLQLDALNAAGCGKVYTETASGAKAERPVLGEVLGYLRPGDTLTEQIDTTTPGGKLIFHVFGALAEFERDLIRERTHAGLAAARARGRFGGRPKKLADAKQLAAAHALYDGGQTDIATICATLGISRATLYGALKGRDGHPSTGR